MRKMVVTVTLFLICLMLLSAGCAQASTGAKPDRQGILLVAFGTSEPDARPAIDNIVTAVRRAFPGVEVRISYTSNIIRKKILREELLAIDPPTVALAKMHDEGFNSVVVQSLHIIPGEEFSGLSELVRAFSGIEGKWGFDRLVLGRPLLDRMEDYQNVAGLLTSKYQHLVKDGGAVVFMGHGTHHEANAAYSKLQLLLDEEGLPFVIGLVEAFPGLDSVKRRLKELNPSRVTLVPFMVVAGDHAKNDRADEDDPESWISELRGDGHEVSALLEGLGDGEEAADLFIGHIREAMERD